MKNERTKKQAKSAKCQFCPYLISRGSRTWFLDYVEWLSGIDFPSLSETPVVPPLRRKFQTSHTTHTDQSNNSQSEFWRAFVMPWTILIWHEKSMKSRQGIAMLFMSMPPFFLSMFPGCRDMTWSGWPQCTQKNCLRSRMHRKWFMQLRRAVWGARGAEVEVEVASPSGARSKIANLQVTARFRKLWRPRVLDAFRNLARFCKENVSRARRHSIWVRLTSA